MIVIINCSPKINNSNCYEIINDFKDRLNSSYEIIYLYRDKIDYIISNMKQSDTIIFVFPLYIDSIPSKLAQLLEIIKDNSLNGKNVYAISQCGFLEAKHNDVAIDIIECFCIINKLNFMGSFKIGAGEVFGKSKFKKYIFISWDYYKKIKSFIKSVSELSIVNLETSIRFIPLRLYMLVANRNWNNMIKEKKKEKYCKNKFYLI